MLDFKAKMHQIRIFLGSVADPAAVAVLGWGQGAQAPPNLAQAPQIFDWFRSALFLLEGF